MLKFNSTMSLLAGVLAAAAVHAAPAEYLATPGSKAPFSPAVRAGDMLYLSGQIGAKPDGTLAPDILDQAKQAMDNVGALLQKSGSSFDDVVKCTVMLTDMSKWADFNEVYKGYFKPGHLPARSAVGVAALALGAKVEVECLAYTPKGKTAR